MPGRRLLIAIVDDEAGVLRALERLVRSAGHDACTYASGEALLASLTDVRPDCLVLDMQMPGISGFDVQAQLRQRRIPLPVVAVTGSQSEQLHKRVRESGFGAFLPKPVDDVALIDAIERLTERPPDAVGDPVPSHLSS